MHLLLCIYVMKLNDDDDDNMMFSWLSALLKTFSFRSVSGTSNRHLIPTDRVPAVDMNGWHVARHWAAGVGGSPLKSKWRRCLSD